MKDYLIFFLLFHPLCLFATDSFPCDRDTDWTMEVRGAYYYLSGTAIKRVYTSHLIDYQVEAAKRVNSFVEVWAGVNWASKRGKAYRTFGDYNFRDRTIIYILPLNLGLKLIYPILPCVDIYAGGGVCYSFLRIRNFCKEHYSDYGFSRSPFRKGIYKNEFGGVFKVGLQFAMSETTFLDFFVDYIAQRFRLSRRDDPRNVFSRSLDCSGFKFGAGFGVYF
jgi:hypothetical protein